MSRSQRRRPSDFTGPAAARSPRVDAAWSLDAARVAAELGVEPTRGLDGAEAAARLARFGANRPRAMPRRSALGIWLRQFRNVTAALLVFASAATFLSDHPVEGWAILAVLLFNSLVGFVTELRAARSMEALRQLVRTTARVLRGGELVELPAEQLVPGDVVVIEGGDVVPADLRLVEASRLQADESTLTGESTPVAKSTASAAADAPLAERPGALYCGSAVTRGSGLGVVVATGELTEIGRIADLVERAEPERTPLERQVARLSSRLVVITLGIVAFTVALGIALGRDPRTMLEIGVALAVAAVPEGLPIVVTLALARGAWRMARRHVLVRRLSAVASLGAANRILTDKTGTLTENRLAVVRLLLAAGDIEVEAADDGGSGRFLSGGVELDPRQEPAIAAALEIAALCNNAALAADGGGIGDPLESALLAAAARAGLPRSALRARFPELREEAFDPAVRAMATYHRDGAGVRIAVKGAPEVVLAASSRELVRDRVEPLGDPRRRDWLERGERLAQSGLRVLALARRSAASDAEPPYQDLEIVALVGLLDPPRRDVRDAIDRCRRAGIRIAMVTGDQPGTARAVARELGLFDSGPETVLEGRELVAGDLGADAARLVDVPVFARVEPEQKLRLIRFFRDRGDVVAMLGDGVNDAPALRQADIGVAMGLRGTQVAREAADLVLEDDALASVVGAIEQGRIILSNLRRFAAYLLSCNATEIVLVGGAAALGAPLPLLPLQILYLNLVTDVFPALALGFGEGDPAVMERGPSEPGTPLLARRHWLRIGGYAATLAASVLTLMLVARFLLGWSERRAATVAFLGLALGQLGHVFDMRGRGSRPLANDVVRNPWIWGAIVLCLALLAAAVHLPRLASLLGTVAPGAAGWGLATLAALAPLLVAQIDLALGGRRTATAVRAPRPRDR